MSGDGTRADYLERDGTLLVMRHGRGRHVAGEPEAASLEPGDDALELFVAVADDGAVTAFNGHVDLGTGIRTALAQVVA